jgi:hypothetical protein
MDRILTQFMKPGSIPLSTCKDFFHNEIEFLNLSAYSNGISCNAHYSLNRRNEHIS